MADRVIMVLHEDEAGAPRLRLLEYITMRRERLNVPCGEELQGRKEDLARGRRP